MLVFSYKKATLLVMKYRVVAHARSQLQTNKNRENTRFLMQKGYFVRNEILCLCHDRFTDLVNARLQLQTNKNRENTRFLIQKGYFVRNEIPSCCTRLCHEKIFDDMCRLS